MMHGRGGGLWPPPYKERIDIIEIIERIEYERED